jgi:hypothetical protein
MVNKAPRYTSDLTEAMASLCAAMVEFEGGTRYSLFFGKDPGETQQEQWCGKILGHMELARRYLSTLTEAVASQDATLIGATVGLPPETEHDWEDDEPDYDDEPPPDVGPHAGAIIREDPF